MTIIGGYAAAAVISEKMSSALGYLKQINGRYFFVIRFDV